MTHALGARAVARDLGAWQDESGRRTSRPAYRALADGIRLLVHDGRVPLGTALPSEREFASELNVSRTTITTAYAVLRDEGYLVSRQGSRSTVTLPAAVDSDRRRVHAHLPVPEGVGVDLSYAAMVAPAEEISEAYSAALQSLPPFLETHGMEPVGITVLREAVAARYRARGLDTDVSQIMITSGAQHALRLLLGVLTAPGSGCWSTIRRTPMRSRRSGGWVHARFRCRCDRREVRPAPGIWAGSEAPHGRPPPGWRTCCRTSTIRQVCVWTRRAGPNWPGSPTRPG